MKANTMFRVCILLSAAILPWIFGCASSQPSQTASADGRTFQRTDRLDRVWLAEGFSFKDYETLVVMPVTSDGLAPTDDKEIERLALAKASLTRDFRDNLEAMQICNSVVPNEAAVKPGTKALKLENVIVKFKPGSMATRMLVGMGTGLPYIRIRGQITEVGSSEPLMIYELDETADLWGSAYRSSRSLQSDAGSELAADVVTFISRAAKGQQIKYR